MDQTHADGFEQGAATDDAAFGIRAVFERPDTTRAIRTTVAAAAAVGFGVGLAGLALTASVGGHAAYGRALVGFVVVGALVVTAPALAAAFAPATASRLDGLDGRLRYATLAAAGALGALAYVFVAGIVVSTATDAANVGGLVVPFLVAALGAAVAAVGVVAARERLDA